MQEAEATVVPGRPIPYVRMTQQGKYVKKNAKRYLDYKSIVGWTYKAKKGPKLNGNIEIGVTVYLHGETTPMGMDGDVDNYIKTAMDSLNKIAYEDDRQVVKATGEKETMQESERRENGNKT